MSKKDYIYGAVILVLLVGIGIGLVSWKDAAVDRAKAQSTSQGLQQIIVNNQQQMDKREQDWKQTQEDFQKQIESIKTLVQARQAIQPVVVQPIPQQQVQRDQLPQQVQQALPDAPSSTKYTLLTDDQMMQLGKFKLQCDESSAELQKCKADTTDLQASLKTSQADTENWKKEAKGGGTWIRFKRGAKWFVVGVGTGAAVYALTHR